MAVAQTGSATVSGTVIDASGARVPNATMVAQSLETSAQRQTTTSSSGVYSLTALAVGHYRLTISAPGFQTFEVNNTQLQVGQNLTVDAQMQPASSATTVEVADTAPPLDETSADVGGVVSAEQVRQLPINGRSWASLETQTPGAIDSGTDNQRSIRFAGHGLDDNNYRFDGVDATGIINQAQKGNFRLQFSTEAVAEFRADAAVYTAENGGTQGGQVNVVSRSGTNDLHGSLFEYFRNSYFDARGPFDLTTLPFRLNQFGGSLGGPIRKDKDFFFVTFEGLRQRISQTLIGYVPSASFRAAVLQTSPALSQVINAYPSSSIPTGDPNVSQYIGAGRQVQNENFGLARYDHKFSDTNTLSVRYNIDNGYLNVPNGVLRDTVTTTLITQNAAITLDTVLSARTVNEFKVGFNRPNYQTHNQSVIDGQITTPQFSTLYNGTGKVQVGNSFNYLDTLTSVHGKHTIKAGAEIRRVQLNATATSSNDYEFTFSSTNNFLHDVLSQASLVNTLPTTGLRRTEYYGYVQDEIRATQTLTLNLGLRYELYGVPYEVKGRGIVFDPLTCPGGYCPPGYSFYKEDWHNFAPRVSFAWAPAAAGNKTVIRAGYGIYYGEGQIGDLTAPLDNLAGRALLTPQSYPGLSYPVNPVLATTAFSFPSP
ncbi:MAG: TonB-dependent receptor, partial [Acidobacteriaceae bacterium]|nr:TonB-dependent receptor [Acidobacteriaceae bacterium]